MKKNLNKALEGQVIPQGVYLPPVFAGGKLMTTYEGYDKVHKASIDQNRIRIQVECDPLGQLMALANGLPIPSLVVSEGEDGQPEIKVAYQTADIKTRVALLSAMVDKIMPNASVVEASNPKKKQDDDKDDNWDELTRKRSAAILEGKSS
jgi:hypothetical protein